MVGLFAVSKKSALLRCSSRFSFLVLTVDASITASMRDCPTLPGS